MFKLHFRLLGLLALITPGLAVAADPILYGDTIGNTMRFLDVRETAMSVGDTAPLFGAPSLVPGTDSLIFNHMNFSSTANGLGGADTTDGKLDMNIEAKNNPGYYIDKIRFQEFGDTSLTGTGTSGTRSSVGSSIFITVLQVDNGTLLFPEFITLNMTMSEGGAWTLADGPITGHIWNGLFDLSLTSVLQARGITGHATQISLSLDNTLTTSSEFGTSAFIAKKAEGLSVTPMLVPEPGTLSLLLLGGLFLRKRR
jgi:hypothetical protein